MHHCAVAARGVLVGSFDLLNIGHIDVIQQLRDRVEVLHVAVLDDDHITLATGLPPVVPWAERAALVRHVRGVDEVRAYAHADSGLQDATLFVIEGESTGALIGSPEQVRPRRQPLRNLVASTRSEEAVA